jgi:RNA polymerase sigma-70 factor (ECF subfamily)
VDKERASDERLLAASDGDAEAFAVFYRRHARAVLAYLVYRTRDGEQAIELCAEVFAAALTSAHRFRPGRVPARGWLFGIANNKLAETRRRGRIADRARRRLGIDRITVPDEAYERVEELVDLERRGPPLSLLIDDLPDAQRQAVVARVIEERSYREIAAGQGVSEEVVRQRVSRGLARLAAWSREGRG